MRDYIGEFGSMLHAARLRQGKKLREIAPLLDAKTASVARWESGDALPPESRLEKMRSVYDIDKNEFAEKFRLAREQRDRDKKTFSKLGKNTTIKPKDIESMFSGGIEVSSSMSRLNRPGGGKGRS